MDHANENKIPQEWVEISALNDRYSFFTKEQMLQWKHRPPRHIGNMLWFMKFELNFRKEAARKKIEIIK